MNKFHHKDEEQKGQQEPPDKTSPPHVSEPDNKVGDKESYPPALFLKNHDLQGLLFHDRGMEFLFLNKHAVAVETDELLIRSSQVKPMGGTAAHRTPGQEPFGPAVPRHPCQENKKEEG
jgi:hypothetical protein